MTGTPSTETQRMIAEAFDDFAKRLLSAGEQITASCAERIAINSREAARSASGAEVKQQSLADRWAAMNEAELRQECRYLFGCMGTTQHLLYEEIRRLQTRIANQRKELNGLQPAAPAPAETTAECTYPNCKCPPSPHHPARMGMRVCLLLNKVPETPGPQPVSEPARAAEGGQTPATGHGDKVVMPSATPAPLPDAAHVPAMKMLCDHTDAWEEHGSLARCRRCGQEAEWSSVRQPPADAAQGKPLELLPCPFCGGRADYEQTEGALREVRWTVGCLENENSNNLCMAYQSLTTFATKREARLAWNTRSTPREP